MSTQSNLQEVRKPSMWEAIIPILFLIALLVVNVIVFKDEGLSGPNQTALMLSTALAGVIASRLGWSWDHIQQGILNSIQAAMPAILILLLIGSLAGTWLISGIVPAMVYYGLQILNPTIFLVAAAIISAIVSLATGSSWSTVATVGLALAGIGKALGLHEGMVAGAIISGAYFGDKMSPLSDTTNLAPAVSGTDLITHVRYMIRTTGPTMAITLVIFLVMGFMIDSSSEPTDISGALQAIEQRFSVSPVLFIVPAVVFGLIAKRAPALPALLLGSLLGGLMAVIMQPDVVLEAAGRPNDPYAVQLLVGVVKAISGHISITTSDPMINELLSSKGMAGMLNTVWLILSAMAFGGVLEASGMLHTITGAIIRRVKTDGQMIASASATCMFFNVTASDQYMSIVVPGKMYEKAFADRGLAPENLSRTLEDSATVTSVLVPWNTCGVAQSAVLGVATAAYAPYAVFCYLSPLMTMIFGFFNIGIKRLPKSPTQEVELPQTQNA